MFDRRTSRRLPTMNLCRILLDYSLILASWHQIKYLVCTFKGNDNLSATSFPTDLYSGKATRLQTRKLQCSQVTTARGVLPAERLMKASCSLLGSAEICRRSASTRKQDNNSLLARATPLSPLLFLNTPALLRPPGQK